MSYRPGTVSAALRELSSKRQENKRLLSQRRRAVFSRCPELEELDLKIRSVMASAALSAFDHKTEAAQAVSEAKSQVLSLKKRISRLLSDLGYPTDYLDEIFFCPICRDTGFNGKKPCKCLLTLCDKLQKKELSRFLNLGDQNFACFDLFMFSHAAHPDYNISPRENIKIINNICKDYATDFGVKMENLYFHGAPGTGKTFMSSCVAAAVSERGFSVVYDTAANLFAAFETEKFNRVGDDSLTMPYLKCDLLILDDLGTELVTNFTLSALYTLVNTRLTEGLSTIISSNLSLKELRKKYTAPIASRIEGEYLNYFFFGDDLRKKKRRDSAI